MSLEQSSKSSTNDSVMALQMIEQQMMQLQKNIQQIQKQSLELDALMEYIDDLGNATHGSETLIPISHGIFAKGTITDTNELVVNVGAGTAVPKSREDTKKMIEVQRVELKKMEEDMLVKLQGLAQNAASIEQQVEK